MKIKWITVDLSLFEGEGGGEATGETGSEATTSAAGKKGEYANVKFGKQPQEEVEEEEEVTEEVDETGEVATPTPEERRKAYDDLIKEYKDFYTEDTQKMINRRFKETKNLEKQISDFKPVMDMLSQRYKTSDIPSLMRAMEDDNTYWEDAAYKAGMEVEQYKKFARLERENYALREAQRQAQENYIADQRVANWRKEEAQMQELYPQFNLDFEIQNPEFAQMIQHGVPVQHAYEVLHMDEIKTSLMQYTAQQTQKAVTDNIRARGNRPLENGATPQNAFTVKNDVTKLSKKDRAEIARRVARGELIEF